MCLGGGLAHGDASLSARPVVERVARRTRPSPASRPCRARASCGSPSNAFVQVEPSRSAAAPGSHVSCAGLLSRPALFVRIGRRPPSLHDRLRRDARTPSPGRRAPYRCGRRSTALAMRNRRQGSRIARIAASSSSKLIVPNLEAQATSRCECPRCATPTRAPRAAPAMTRRSKTSVTNESAASKRS